MAADPHLNPWHILQGGGLNYTHLRLIAPHDINSNWILNLNSSLREQPKTGSEIKHPT